MAYGDPPSAFTSVSQSHSTIRTIVTTATFPQRLPKLLSVLASPKAIFTLNPLVVDFSSFTDSTFTVVDRLTFLRCLYIKTSYTATFEYREGNPLPTVVTRAALGVRTRSTWYVEKDPVKGGCRVVEKFELVKAPIGTRRYILRKARKGHRILFDKLGEALERGDVLELLEQQKVLTEKEKLEVEELGETYKERARRRRTLSI